MSAVSETVDWLLTGLLLPATRLLWIHSLVERNVWGLVPVGRLAANCAVNDSRCRINWTASRQAGSALRFRLNHNSKFGEIMCDELVGL